LAGCAWIKPESGGGSAGNGSTRASGVGPGRGTTGVSSGADFGADVTGSDAVGR